MSAHYLLCGMLVVSVILAWKTMGELMTLGYQTMGGAHDTLGKDHGGAHGNYMYVT